MTWHEWSHHWQNTLLFTEEEGKHTERDLNSRGPGESCFIYGDVTKEPDIKVKCLQMY